MRPYLDEVLVANQRMREQEKCMKIFVSHDETGAILSIGVPDERYAEVVGLKAMENQKVSVLDEPRISNLEQMEDFVRNYRVDTKSGKSVLQKLGSDRY
jgi:hypothetical protein